MIPESSANESLTTPPTLEWATAQSTYRIIVTLLDHVESSASLIALMASVLGEGPTKGITESSAWASYLTSRRGLETLKPELERYVATINKLAEAQPDPAPTTAEVPDTSLP